MVAVTGIPRRLLGEGEQVHTAVRPHWKELALPVVVLLLVAPLTTYVVAVVPAGDAQSWLRLAAGLAAAAVLLRLVLVPFLGWLTTAYVLTDRRLITRVGVLVRRGRDVPLSRVQDVSFEHGSLLARLLGCGTLMVESGGEGGRLVLRDVPRVEDVQRDVHRLAEDDDERRRGPARPQPEGRQQP
jgi:uncharacterized membrane protein YdbT with pleckstrin-like domain